MPTDALLNARVMHGLRTRASRLARTSAIAFALVASAVFGACRGVGDLTGPTPVNVPVASVEISTVQLSLVEGSSVALQVTARNESNQTVTDRKVVWSTSDSAVARVSSAGLVTAVRAGTAQIAVTVEGKSAVARLTVSARAVATVQVTPTTPTLLTGGFLQLTARTLDETGGVLTNRPVFWSTTDPTVVVVDANGLLTGITPGVASVTAISESRSATVGVTVLRVPVSRVALTPARDTIIVGQSTQFTATPLDSAGVRLDDLVTFTSSVPAIATVSSSGIVQAIAAGTITITATAGGRSATATVVVLARPVGAVIVSPERVSLTVGQTLKLSVQVTDASGNLLTGRPISYVSSAPTVVRVATDGTLTVLATGTATITVTSEGKTGTATVTALPSPVASLRIAPVTASVIVGNSLRLQADALDAAGAVLGQRVVTWTSGAPSVVSVAGDGTVTGVAPGTALVFASSEGKIAAATITVTGITAATVTVSPSTATIIAGDAQDLTATVRDAGGAVLNGRVIQWTSSNPTVAVVSNSGRVRGVAPGTARIDATVDGVIGSSNATILQVPVSSVVVSLSPTVVIGQSTLATAVLRDAAGNVLTNRGITWASSNPAVATVNAASGLVTSVATGTTNITATSEGKIGQAAIAVIPIPVASVSVTLGASSLFVGSTTQASAVTRDASGNVLTGRAVSWSSSNASVATVDANSGVVTAVGAGTANIIGSSGGQSGQATITIAQVPVASVSVALASPTVFVGATTQATATTRDAANNVLTGRAIAWSSSNPSVATVSSAGVVTAQSPGSANIIAVSEGQTGQAAITVQQAPVATVTVSLGSSTVVAGANTQASAITRDANNNVLTGRPIAWSSSDPSVASVDPNTGLVTGVSAGTASIIATSEGKTGQATISVTPPPVATVSVSLTASSVVIGATSQASAVTRDANGNVLTGRPIVWSSSDPSVATVDPSTGLVTAVDSGSANIIATSQGKSGQATITVTVVPVASVTVSLANQLIVAGGTTQATAQTLDAAGNVLTGRVIAWSSTDPSVARVSTTGLVTAISAGVVFIRATSEGKSDTAILIVIP